MASALLNLLADKFSFIFFYISLFPSPFLSLVRLLVSYYTHNEERKCEPHVFFRLAWLLPVLFLFPPFQACVRSLSSSSPLFVSIHPFNMFPSPLLYSHLTDEASVLPSSLNR